MVRASKSQSRSLRAGSAGTGTPTPKSSGRSPVTTECSRRHRSEWSLTFQGPPVPLPVVRSTSLEDHCSAEVVGHRRGTTRMTVAGVFRVVLRCSPLFFLSVWAPLPGSGWGTGLSVGSRTLSLGPLRGNGGRRCDPLGRRDPSRGTCGPLLCVAVVDGRVGHRPRPQLPAYPERFPGVGRGGPGPRLETFHPEGAPEGPGTNQNDGKTLPTHGASTRDPAQTEGLGSVVGVVKLGQVAPL